MAREDGQQRGTGVVKNDRLGQDCKRNPRSLFFLSTQPTSFRALWMLIQIAIAVKMDQGCIMGQALSYAFYMPHV